MSVHGIEVTRIDGNDESLAAHRGKAVLVVNVASKCGFTPQYEGLQRLYETYRDRGLEILGFPCNQFLQQEPASNDEIATFCSATYGVSFPMYEKCEVNGDERHALFAELTAVADADGESGDVKWNFEKFLIGADGTPVARFRTQVEPEDPALVGAIERALP